LLAEGPIARFRNTVADAGILALLRSNAYTKMFPTLVNVFASLAAAAFRMILVSVVEANHDTSLYVFICDG
jgi:hypothetical protein